MCRLLCAGSRVFKIFRLPQRGGRVRGNIEDPKTPVKSTSPVGIGIAIEIVVVLPPDLDVLSTCRPMGKTAASPISIPMVAPDSPGALAKLRHRGEQRGRPVVLLFDTSASVK